MEYVRCCIIGCCDLDKNDLIPSLWGENVRC